LPRIGLPTEAAAVKEVAVINTKMISTVIYRIARRALSAEERIGQRIQRITPKSRGYWCK
jgi:hypothetical protein